MLDIDDTAETAVMPDMEDMVEIVDMVVLRRSIGAVLETMLLGRPIELGRPAVASDVPLEPLDQVALDMMELLVFRRLTFCRGAISCCECRGEVWGVGSKVLASDTEGG